MTYFVAIFMHNIFSGDTFNLSVRGRLKIKTPNGTVYPTAKHFSVINKGESFFDMHTGYWNNPDVANVILQMFELNEGK